MRINQNVPSLAAYRNLLMNNNRYTKSLERLTSGMFINRSADDAAGLAISEKMRGQIRGLNQAGRNAQDGIALIQNAEGALNETHAIMQRMRELSVQAASDTLTRADRAEIQKEIDQLTSEIDRIATTTEFNQKKLLDGTTSALSSSDNLQTKVFVRDGLQVTDQFGQRVVTGGNFKIDIEADPGEGQVQKTDIMKSNRETLEINYVPIEGAAGLQAALQEFPGLSGLAIVIEDPERAQNQTLAVYPAAEADFGEIGDDKMVGVVVRPATDGAGNITTTVGEIYQLLIEERIPAGFGDADGLQVLTFQGVADGGEAGGMFRLAYNGVNSDWITVASNPETTAAAIQTALEGIAAIGEGNIAVTWVAGQGHFEIAFINNMAGREVERIEFVGGASALPGIATVTVEQAMEQRIVFITAKHEPGDTFELNLGEMGQTGNITVGENFGATADNIRDAIESKLNGDVTVTVISSTEGENTVYTVTLSGNINNAVSEINSIGQISFVGGVEDFYSMVMRNHQPYNWTVDTKVRNIGFTRDESQFDILTETAYYQGTAGRYFTLSFFNDPTNPYITRPIQVKATAEQTSAEMQSALNSLLAENNELPGTVTVTWVGEDDNYQPDYHTPKFDCFGPEGAWRPYYRFVFSEAHPSFNLAGYPVLGSTADGHQTELTKFAASNDNQLLVFDEATPSGTFILSYSGQQTDSIPIGASGEETASNIQAALNATFENGIVVDHRTDADGSVYIMDFTGSALNPTGALGYTQGPAFTGGDGSVRVVTEGSSAVFLDDLVLFRLTGNGDENIIEPGITLLSDPFASLPAGNLAGLETSLGSIDRFYDASGNFFLGQPQTITLFQGDGRRAEMTLFGTDTIGNVEAKLNKAIHEGLGQGEYAGNLGGTVDPETGKSEIPAYVRFVAEGEADPEGLFSVAGTFVIQSAIVGGAGEITFSGDDRVLEALSLTTIREAQESVFTVNVSDAHSGETVAHSVKAAGNLLVGVVHSNVDVAFDPMANTTVTAAGGAFAWSRDNSPYSTFVHLADNSMVFHIGANPLQDIRASIGDMSAEALGVNSLSVGNRLAANRSIGRVDEGIRRVSAERAKIGAIQNRLEHTISSLGVASENLTAAESRIRDVDLAREIGELTRSQLQNQAGMAIMAQANMRPQTILTLIA